MADQPHQPSPYVPTYENDPSKYPQPPINSAYPPPPQYTPNPNFPTPPTGQQLVINVQPGVPKLVNVLVFGMTPQPMTCFHCHANITTGVRPRSGLLTWLICGGLTLFGCWPCCFIPFCVSSCQDVEHFCPQCLRLLGTFRRI